MKTIRKAEDRGQTRLGWLDSRHSFSFGNYHDPSQMGFRGLRVINDDRVVPGGGFGAHPHRDMEIISYVVDGGLEHRDSMGNGSVIRAGDVQRMSAGTGVTHSEFNASKTEPVRFLQIWIPPTERGLPPSYDQKHFNGEERRGRLRLLVSPDGEDGSLTMHSSARLYGALLAEGEAIRYEVPEGRHVWVQVVRGGLEVDGERLGEGDGAAFSDEPVIELRGTGDAEILLFDLA